MTEIRKVRVQTAWEKLTTKTRNKLVAIRNVLRKVVFPNGLLGESTYVLESYGLPVRYLVTLVEESQLLNVRDVLGLALDLESLVALNNVGNIGATQIMSSLIRYSACNKTTQDWPCEETILIRSAEVRTGLHLEDMKHKFAGWDDRTYQQRARGLSHGNQELIDGGVEVTMSSRNDRGHRINKSVSSD